MNDEKRRKWLEGLKEGDVVLLHEGGRDDATWFKCAVKIANENYVGTSWTLFTREDGESGRSVIFPLDDEEAVAAYEMQRLEYQLGRLYGKANEYKDLPIAKVRKLLAILEEKEPPHDA